MSFKTHNDKKISVCGTYFQGELDMSYARLKKLFGKPTNGDGYKVDAEWMLEFDDGTVATIYNYKDGKNYNGKHGTPKTKIRDWHVGGFSERAVDLVREAYYGTEQA